MKKTFLMLLMFISTILVGCESEESFSVDVEVLIEEKEDILIDDKNPTKLEVKTSDSIYSYLNSLPGEYDSYYVNESVDITSYSKIDDIYEAHQTNVLGAVIVVSTVEGRWGPINFVFSIDVTTNKIIDFDVFDSSEKWGSFISKDSFQSQFTGTDLDFYSLNLFELGIDGNADATTTISSVYLGLSQIISMYNSNFK